MPEDDDKNGVFIRVTNKDIWNELQEIKKTIKFVPEDHKKIRALELKVYWVMAGVSGAFIAIGYAVIGGN